MNIPQRRQQLRESGMQLRYLRAKVADLQEDMANEWAGMPGMLGLVQDGMARDLGELQDALNFLDQAADLIDGVVGR